eukprot:gene19747-22451_t
MITIPASMILLLLCTLVCQSSQASSIFPQSEYEALHELYLTAGGYGWTWKSSGGNEWDFSVYQNPCDQQWQGLTCTLDTAQNTSYVQEIVLAGYNMTGHLIDSLGNFPKLIKLELKNNSLVGAVPPGLGNLESLQILNLNRNKFTTVPQSLGDLSDLTLLDFYSNELTGPFPAFIQRLTKLTYLDFTINKLTGELPEFIGSLHLMERFYVTENNLVGNIPNSIGNCADIIDLYLNNNTFDGTVPRSISQLQSLSYLFLQDNELRGNLDGVFNSTMQTNLSMVLLSHNQFTGSLPDELFLLPSLTVIEAGANCIRNNPLTKNICEATNLQTIALDGMFSSPHCRESVFPGDRSTYQLTSSLQNGVDPCIYALPNLITLHLSSNGLTGQLPEVVNFAPSFTNLGLSHNFLVGNIPSDFQTRGWASLDLSYNELSGVLISNFSTIQEGATLSLRVNRLSGSLPKSIVHAPSEITVIEGNLFFCRQGGSDLPKEDDYFQQYQCGSNLFNFSYYAWVSMTAVMVCTAMVYFAYRKDKKVSFDTTFGKFMHNARKAVDIVDIKLDFEEYEFDVGRSAIVSIDVDDDEDVAHKAQQDPRLVKIRLRHYHRICCICKLIVSMCVTLTVYVVLILLPLYGIISIYYSTLTHQYAYQLSLTFAHGLAPLLLCLFFLMLALVFLSYRFVYYYKEFKSTFEAFEREIGVQPVQRDTTVNATEKSDSSTVVYLGRGKGLIYVLLI